MWRVFLAIYIYVTTPRMKHTKITVKNPQGNKFDYVVIAKILGTYLRYQVQPRTPVPASRLSPLVSMHLHVFPPLSLVCTPTCLCICPLCLRSSTRSRDFTVMPCSTLGFYWTTSVYRWRPQLFIIISILNCILAIGENSIMMLSTLFLSPYVLTESSCTRRVPSAADVWYHQVVLLLHSKPTPEQSASLPRLLLVHRCNATCKAYS